MLRQLFGSRSAWLQILTFSLISHQSVLFLPFLGTKARIFELEDRAKLLFRPEAAMAKGRCSGLNGISTSHPQCICVLNPEPAAVTLFRKRVFADVIKLRILRWVLSGLLGGALNPVTSVSVRERQGEMTQPRDEVLAVGWGEGVRRRREESDEALGQEMPAARQLEAFSQRALWGSACGPAWFWVLASTSVREWSSVVGGPGFVAVCYGSSRKLIQSNHLLWSTKLGLKNLADVCTRPMTSLIFLGKSPTFVSGFFSQKRG